MDNIKVVDDIVRDTEKLFSDFFGDEDTSYIFTADHGMSVIGNHGDGGLSCSCSAPWAAPPILLIDLHLRSRQHSYTTHCMGLRHSRTIT